MALTKAEEQLMNYIWRLEKSFFKEIKEQYPEPSPATTTINTLLKRLINKKFIDYKVFGNSREYFPIIDKNGYYSKHIKGIIKNSFNNSIEQFASFFTKETNLSDKELKMLRKIVDKQINSKSGD